VPSFTTNNFAVVLAKKHLKISETARKTGISRTTLTNLYYNKSSAISFEVLSKLCGFLNCDVGDIITCDKGVN
jgi:Predicted transcriptional regulator